MQALRLYFRFHDGCGSLWHGQQCTLTEYCAYVARDILCHIDLAAEARVKLTSKKPTAVAVDEDDDSGDDASKRWKAPIEFEDLGGVVSDDADDEKVAVTEVSAHPLPDPYAAASLLLIAIIWRSCGTSLGSATRTSRCSRSMQSMATWCVKVYCFLVMLLR